MARLGMVWHRWQGRAWRGGVRFGKAGHGGVWLVGWGWVSSGLVRRAMAG